MSRDALVGKQIGQYDILALLGYGDISSVYRARQLTTEQIVAVKVFHSDAFDEPTFQSRFEHEVRILSRLEHPHILPIYDVGRDQDITYIVMRYVAGGTLADLLKRYGQLTPEEIVPVIQQVASALDYAHQRGILHRNLKPSNILLDEEGDAYLSDFSLARVREALVMMTNAGYIGTPAYIAPEVARGERILTPAVDIYELGVILFEALTGRLPFEAESSAAQVMLHVNEPAPSPRTFNPEIPPEVEAIILKALAKNPEERFRSAGELSRALTLATGVTTDAVRRPDITALLPRQEEVKPLPVPLPEADEDTHPTRHEAAPGRRAIRRWRRQRERSARRRSGARWYTALLGLLLLIVSWFVVGVVGGLEVRRQVNQATLVAIHNEQTRVAEVAATQANATLNAVNTATQEALSAMMTATALIATETPRPTVTPTPTPTLTPTPFAGSQGLIALVSERDGDAEIFILNPASGELTQVTANGVDDGGPAWSPDGSLLAFHSPEDPTGQHIYVVDSNGQNRRQITRGFRIDSTPLWSPNGATLAYFSIDGTRSLIRSHVLDGDEETTLVQLPPGVGEVTLIDWAPDGETLTIFGFPPTSTVPDIQRVALDTGLREPITKAAGDISFLSYSPDRSMVAFAATVNNRREVFLANAACPIVNECIIRQLTDDPFNYYTPRFSPDGTLLLVSSDRTGNLDLYALDLDGEIVQQFTDSRFDEYGGTWQPAP